VVELLSERSPALIFQNEKGGRSKIIDIAGIKGRYPNVKDVYNGDLQRPDAADKVREAIQFYAQQLPHIGEEVPAKWVSIRTEIETRAQEESYISEDAYFEIYGRHLNLDKVKARHLSRYLHDLGVFLHFQDHPLLRRTVILENEWATEAVFHVLDHEQTKAAQGHFTSEDCAKIWSDSKYADMHEELLALMEQFELCYRVPDSKPTSWLAPQLIPLSIPETLTKWGKPDDLALSYRYDFLPKGLISRLMVRMHRFVKQPELAWTGGVLFEQKDNQLLVRTTASGKDVVLSVRGPERKALLSVIASDLDALNASFGGLEEKVEKRVPCICSSCCVSSEPEFFDERKLLKRKRANQHTVQCDESFKDVSVLELLDGLKLEDLPS
jgi:internalin A